MVGADDEAFELVKPAVQAVGVAGGARGRTRRRNPDEVGAQHVHFISFAAACEASRLAEAAGINLQDLGRWCATATRISGGAGAIMVRDDTKPLAARHFLYDLFLHTRIWARRT